MTIWWVPTLWHSVTPPLKNPGYGPEVIPLFKSDKVCYWLLSMVTTTRAKQVIITKFTWNFVPCSCQLFVYDIITVTTIFVIDLQSKTYKFILICRAVSQRKPSCNYVATNQALQGQQKLFLTPGSPLNYVSHPTTLFPPSLHLPLSIHLLLFKIFPL